MFASKILYIVGTILAVSLIAPGSASEEYKTITVHENELTKTEISPFLKENEIIALFETIREKIKKGITIAGINIPLDPFNTGNILCIPLKPKGNIIRGKIYAKNVLLEGLAGFKLYDVKLSIISLQTAKLTLGLRFPRLHFSVNYYKADLKIMDKVHIFGKKGNVDVLLRNADTYIELPIQYLPTIKLRTLVNDIQLPQTNVTIAGLFDDERLSKIISRQLEDALQTLAVEENERFNDLVTKFANGLIEKVINPCLKGITIAHIPGIISGEVKLCQDLEELVERSVSNLIDSLGIEEDSVDLLNCRD